jgi:tetratricopeptide (TPR) repeat protein
LSIIAQEQIEFQQAKRYFQQALQIEIYYNTRYEQAFNYLHLGIIAHQQREFQEAEQYYQQALQIYVEYNDRYEQARTYYSLGLVAQEQREFQQAGEYFLTALRMYVYEDDTYWGGFVLLSLARLGSVNSDKDLPAAIASILGATVEETVTLLQKMLEAESGKADSG